MEYVKGLNLLGVEARQLPTLTGTDAPTTSTVGAVGELYMNTTNGDIYKCIAVNEGSYTWEIALSGAAIDIPDSLPNPYKLTLGNNLLTATYDGSADVDFTPMVNMLIDDKLGVIENGSY